MLTSSKTMYLLTNTTATSASRVGPQFVPQPELYLIVPTVMRACEGCRRRKIRCDSATTNTWPCAACTRLKLHCVPPSVSYEAESSDTGTTTSTFELHKSSSYPELSQSSTTEFQHHTLPQQYGTIDSTMQSSLQSQYIQPHFSDIKYELIWKLVLNYKPTRI
jgi:hypothetical protein